jgi:di/tricarboxylate transporter
MSHATISLLILLVVIAIFVWNRLPVGSVAILTALALYATGVLPLGSALAGFGDPVVIFIAALFVVSEGIDAAGVTTWAGQALLARVGDRPAVVLAAVMALTAVVSALITINGATAALLPMVVVMAARIRVPAAHMLMPMVFAGSAGSLLVLTASPVNVLASDASRDSGRGGFSFFAFSVVGIPLVLGTMAICVALSRRVLPVRPSTLLPPDLSAYASTVADHYELRDGFYRLRVRAQSTLIGADSGAVDLSAYPGVDLIGLQAGGDTPAPVRHALELDDVLIVGGPSEQISELAMREGLAVAMRPLGNGAGPLVNREMGVAELVVPPRSPLVGETVFPGMVRSSELVILAIRRLGKDRGQRPTDLAEGDTLLVHGSWGAVESLSDHGDVLVVNSPDLVRRQAVPLGAKAFPAIAVLAGMVVLLAAGLVPPAVAGLLAATAMVLLRVVSVPQAYRSVSWQTVVLIGGLIPLSTAIRESGAADDIARVLLDVVGSGGPRMVMLALFLLTVILGQFVSNTATVLIVLPVALAAAAESQVSAQPILMMIAVAGAASFLTPIATPANMMVMGPAGYRFGDYWRLGLPILGWWTIVALGLVPLVWPL